MQGKELTKEPPIIGEGIAEGPKELLEKGKTLVQTKAQYQTAVAVQKPRDLKVVRRKCLDEAEIAGENFLYSMTFKTKKGPRLVEGPSIKLANAALRNWGNCVLVSDVKEERDYWVFFPTVIDLESGYNANRAKRVSKNRTVFGNFDEERKMEIRFETGQSIAIRNVAINFLPGWLVEEMKDVAKNAAIEKIKKMGVDTARQKALDFFDRHGVEQDRVEFKIGKKATKWNEHDLALLFGAMRSLTDGAEAADDLFPPVEATGSDKPNVGDGKTGEKKEREQDVTAFVKMQMKIKEAKSQGDCKDILDEIDALYEKKKLKKRETEDLIKLTNLRVADFPDE